MFNSLIVAGLLILAIAYPHQAAAVERDISQFVRASQEIPARLLNAGYSKIGRLDIRKLYQQASRVPVIPVDSETMLRLNRGERAGARWQRQGRQSVIYFNAEFWQGDNMPEVRPVIALHEHLGIAGYDDHNYQLSIALWLLSRNDIQLHFTSAEKRTLHDDVVTLARSGGGVIGVGGGGDNGSLFIRMNMMQNSVDSIIRSRDRAVRRNHLNIILTYLHHVNVEIKWRRVR